MSEDISKGYTVYSPIDGKVFAETLEEDGTVRIVIEDAREGKRRFFEVAGLDVVSVAVGEVVERGYYLGRATEGLYIGEITDDDDEDCEDCENGDDDDDEQGDCGEGEDTEADGMCCKGGCCGKGHCCHVVTVPMPCPSPHYICGLPHYPSYPYYQTVTWIGYGSGTNTSTASTLTCNGTSPLMQATPLTSGSIAWTGTPSTSSTLKSGITDVLYGATL